MKNLNSDFTFFFLIRILSGGWSCLLFKWHESWYLLLWALRVSAPTECDYYDGKWIFYCWSYCFFFGTKINKKKLFLGNLPLFFLMQYGSLEDRLSSCTTCPLYNHDAPPLFSLVEPASICETASNVWKIKKKIVGTFGYVFKVVGTFRYVFSIAVEI